MILIISFKLYLDILSKYNIKIKLKHTLLHITLLIIYFGSSFASANELQTDKYLLLLNPRGTEIYNLGSKILIEWDYKSVDKIRIDFLNTDNNWESLFDEVPAFSKKINWEINSDLPKLLKLRIIDITDSKIFDITPYFVEIRASLENILNNSNFELKKMTSLSTLKIMPLGNSITQGYTLPVPDEREGYRKNLKILTENSGLNFDFVGSETNGFFYDNQHEGHGGWHVNHWYTSPKTLLDSIKIFLSKNLPDIILLHAGTNDIGEYDYSTRINDNTIDTTVADISNMLDSIYNVDPTILVILAKIVNRSDDSLTVAVNERDTTTAFNNTLEIMANSRITNGDRLILVDMENPLNYPDDLCLDGVHPNSYGYEKMSQVWFNGIKSILPKINLVVALEGPYNSTDMTSNLILPNAQPFNSLPWLYSGKEYSDDIPIEVIDWVLVSLRSNTDKDSEVACRAGFLLGDGSIVDLDGTSPLAFAVDQGSYYVVVEHRNHLPIMSSIVIPLSP